MKVRPTGDGASTSALSATFERAAIALKAHFKPGWEGPPSLCSKLSPCHHVLPVSLGGIPRPSRSMPHGQAIPLNQNVSPGHDLLMTCHFPFRGTAFTLHSASALQGACPGWVHLRLCTLSLRTRWDLFLPNLCRHFISYMF